MPNSCGQPVASSSITTPTPAGLCTTFVRTPRGPVHSSPGCTTNCAQVVRRFVHSLTHAFNRFNGQFMHRIHRPNKNNNKFFIHSLVIIGAEVVHI